METSVLVLQLPRISVAVRDAASTFLQFGAAGIRMLGTRVRRNNRIKLFLFFIHLTYTYAYISTAYFGETPAVQQSVLDFGRTDGRMLRARSVKCPFLFARPHLFELWAFLEVTWLANGRGEGGQRHLIYIIS